MCFWQRRPFRVRRAMHGLDLDQRHRAAVAKMRWRQAELCAFLFSSLRPKDTREKLAKFAAERLTRAGHRIRVCGAIQSNLPDPGDFEAAQVIASVHLARYAAPLMRFARENHGALNAMPSALVSVSLSAAGDNPSDLAGLRDCVERLERDTRWRPVAVHHAAGAMPFSAYGFFTKLAIKSIVRRGVIVDTAQDYDLTDYTALGAFIDRLVASAIPSAAKQMATAH